MHIVSSSHLCACMQLGVLTCQLMSLVEYARFVHLSTVKRQSLLQELGASSLPAPHAVPADATMRIQRNKKRRQFQLPCFGMKPRKPPGAPVAMHDTFCPPMHASSHHEESESGEEHVELPVAL